MKKLLSLLLVWILLLSLTGCHKLDYRRAIDLYNRGNYDAAVDLFHELGDYQDSAELFTLSHYWAAIARMEEGKFSEALPRFLKLGDYEDSAQRATECTYQMALAEYEAGNYHEAQNYFRKVTDYKQSSEYLRRINWLAFFDAMGNAPIEKEHSGKYFRVCADRDSRELLFSVESSVNEPFYFADSLLLTLTCDSTEASFSCQSSFGMDFVDGQIGSTQKAAGKVEITTCTAETKLIVDAFEKTVNDNLGQTITSTDPADNVTEETMDKNFADLLRIVPALLLEAGMELTLNDIGFYAL